MTIGNYTDGNRYFLSRELLSILDRDGPYAYTSHYRLLLLEIQ